MRKTLAETDRNEERSKHTKFLFLVLDNTCTVSMRINIPYSIRVPGTVSMRRNITKKRQPPGRAPVHPWEKRNF
jgi:hypothetical protein